MGARSAEEAVHRPQSAPRLSLANRVSHVLQRRFDVFTSLFTP
ncbi:hypothetical protein GCM10018963_28570 [Saccharothrix longispora]